jgi:transaldolase
MYRRPYISGFTQSDADAQSRDHGLPEFRPRGPRAAIPDRPISFEVFSDEFSDMERQAEIAGWGGNVYVKIPSRTPVASRMSWCAG